VGAWRKGQTDYMEEQTEKHETETRTESGDTKNNVASNVLFNILAVGVIILGRMMAWPSWLMGGLFVLFMFGPRAYQWLRRREERVPGSPPARGPINASKNTGYIDRTATEKPIPMPKKHAAPIMPKGMSSNKEFEKWKKKRR